MAFEVKFRINEALYECYIKLLSFKEAEW